MIDKPLLNQIKNMKQEYGIGSMEALAMTRVWNGYEEMRNRVAERQEGRNASDVRDIANICTSVRDCIGTVIQDVSFSLEEPEVSSVPVTIRRPIVFPVAKHPYLMAWDDSQKEDGSVVIAFDYEKFLGQVYRTDMPRTKAYKQAITHVLRSDHPYFKIDDYNYSLFELLASNLLVNTDEPDYLAKSNETPHYAIERLRQFIQWIRCDINVPHYEPRPAGALIREEIAILLAGAVSGRSYHDRALRDGTVHFLESQRRIALNEILMRFPKNTTSPFEAIEQSVGIQGVRLSDAMKIKRKLDKEGIAFLGDGYSDRRITYANNVIHAIQSNRKWLERMLTH
ncbi:MAG: hypothetical protein ABIA93_05260 [Candidatus Woesearchaeota archaeon]